MIALSPKSAINSEMAAVQKPDSFTTCLAIAGTRKCRMRWANFIRQIDSFFRKSTQGFRAPTQQQSARNQPKQGERRGDFGDCRETAGIGDERAGAVAQAAGAVIVGAGDQAVVVEPIGAGQRPLGPFGGIVGLEPSVRLNATNSTKPLERPKKTRAVMPVT